MIITIDMVIQMVVYNYSVNIYLIIKQNWRKLFAVLEKLNELAFDKFEFNEELNFTQEAQKNYTLLSDNFDITYLDNLTAIPSYNPGVISYKTNDSSYKITVRVSLGKVVRYNKKNYFK